jgi:hypothetical protein
LSTSGWRTRAARDHVERTRREAGFEHQLGKEQGGQRRLRGRLQDHGAPGRERRRDLPAGDVEREIPRDDRADHADRLPQGVGQEVAFDGQRIPHDLVGPPGVIAQGVDGHRQLDLGLEQRLAVLGRFEPGELVEPCVQEVGGFGQQPAALAGREVAPRRRREARFRGLHGGVHVRGVARRDLRQHFLGRGIDDGEALARSGGAPLVGYEEIGPHRITFP